jgi:hypothetical protein
VLGYGGVCVRVEWSEFSGADCGMMQVLLIDNVRD